MRFRSAIPPGSQFADLTVICRDTSPREGRNSFYICRCKCGGGCSVRADKLRDGRAKSCGGCVRKRAAPVIRKPRTRFTAEHKREYSAWSSMRDRCNNENNRAFHRYGGRGIYVCERWSSFAAFVEDMGERPEGMSLDRIDNAKGYSPENCRWATARQQILNSSVSKPITIDGVTYPSMADAADAFGICRTTFRERVRKGWTGPAGPVRPKQKPKT